MEKRKCSPILPHPDKDDAEALAVAAEAADLQVHHALLFYLEKSRRAMLTMVHALSEDAFGEFLLLTQCRDPWNWLDQSTTIMVKAVNEILSAQTEAMAAWTDMQMSIFTDMGANATPCAWASLPVDPSKSSDQSSRQQFVRPWVEETLSTWHMMADALADAQKLRPTAPLH